MMQIREAAAADRDAILALRVQCFGDEDPEKRDPRFWEWEFRDARCFIAEEEGRIVSHLGLVQLPDGPVLAVDAMTAPSARGKGVFSRVVAAAMDSTSDVCTAYQIRSAVLGSMLRGGWTVAEKVPVLVRPLWFGRRDAGGPAGEDAGVPERRRPGGWSGGVPPPRATRDDTHMLARIARSENFLSWRFFSNPHWQYRVTAIEDKAYLAARRTTLKGYDTYAITDLAFNDRKAAKTLLKDAVSEAKRQGCKLAAALVSKNHPAFWLFIRSGFLPSPHRFRLLVYPNVKRRWQVMWADTDHL